MNFFVNMVYNVPHGKTEFEFFRKINIEGDAD